MLLLQPNPPHHLVVLELPNLLSLLLLALNHLPDLDPKALVGHLVAKHSSLLPLLSLEPLRLQQGLLEVQMHLVVAAVVFLDRRRRNQPNNNLLLAPLYSHRHLISPPKPEAYLEVSPQLLHLALASGLNPRQLQLGASLDNRPLPLPPPPPSDQLPHPWVKAHLGNSNNSPLLHLVLSLQLQQQLALLVPRLHKQHLLSRRCLDPIRLLLRSLRHRPLARMPQRPLPQRPLWHLECHYSALPLSLLLLLVQRLDLSLDPSLLLLFPLEVHLSLQPPRLPMPQRLPLVLEHPPTQPPQLLPLCLQPAAHPPILLHP